MGTNQIQVNLKFNADVQQAKQSMLDLQNSLRSLTTTDLSKSMGSMGLTQEIQEATVKVTQLRTQLEAATNVNTGKLNLKTFNTQLKTSGNTLEQYKASLMALGPAGQQAFAQLARSVATAETPFISLSARMEKTFTTLANTARWQLASSVINGLSGAMQRAYGYAQDLNKSLTDIRIVSGYGADEMARFAEKANKAAKALSSTTTAYTNAALIYYQQGLSNAEVEERTNTTIKMANVTGENAEAVSSYMTAIWNNFDDGSKSLEYYADVITALGAATAASSEEIAGGLEKFAAIGETIGLSYEYATAALTTIVAETRQSEDVVGTALKTIFARIQGLKLGESLEDGTDLNKYSEALATIGVNIKDSSGELKNMDTILDEVGGKWDSLAKAEQMALAQTVAGVRQYTQFIALMDNYQDVFQENLSTAYNAEGSLDEQQEVYAESWEGASKRAQAAMENIYQSLLNDEFFIKLTNMFAEMGEGLGEFLDNIGGAKTVLLLLGSIITQVFNQQIVKGITNAGNSIYSMTSKGKEEMNSLRNSAFEMLKTLSNSEGLNNLYDQMASFEQKIIEAKKNATEAERQYYDQVLKTGRALFDQAIASQQVADAAKEKQKNALNAQNKTVSDILDSEFQNYQNQQTWETGDLQTSQEKAITRRDDLNWDYRKLTDQYRQVRGQELGREVISELPKADYEDMQRYVNNILENPASFGEDDLNIYKELKEILIDVNNVDTSKLEDALRRLGAQAEQAGENVNTISEQIEHAQPNEQGMFENTFNDRLAKGLVDTESWNSKTQSFERMATINKAGETSIGGRLQEIDETAEKNILKLKTATIETTAELSKFQQVYNQILGAGEVDLGFKEELPDLEKNKKALEEIKQRLININNIDIPEGQNFMDIIGKENMPLLNDLENSLMDLKIPEDTSNLTKEQLAEIMSKVEGVSGKFEELRIKTQNLFGEKIDFDLGNVEVDFKKASSGAEALSKNISKIKSSKEFANLEKTLPGVAKAMDKLQVEAAEVAKIDFSKLKGKELDEAKNKVKNLQNAYESLGSSLGDEISKNDALKKALTNIFGPELVNKWVSDAHEAGKKAGDAAANGFKTFNTEELEKQLQRGKQKIQNFAQGLTDLSSSLMTVSMGIQAIKSLGEIWSNDDLSTGEKIAQTMMSLSMIIPVVTMALQNKTLSQLADNLASGQSFKLSMMQALGIKAKKAADDGENKALGTKLGLKIALQAIDVKRLIITLAIIAALAVLVAIAWGVVKVFEAIKASSPEEKLKQAREETTKAEESFQRAKQAAEELKQTLESYDGAVNKLKSLKIGTDEYRQAMEEANAEARKMIDDYNLLAGQDWSFNSATGLIEFNDGVLENVEKQANERQIVASANVYHKQEQEAKIKNDIKVSDMVEQYDKSTLDYYLPALEEAIEEGIQNASRDRGQAWSSNTSISEFANLTSTERTEETMTPDISGLWGQAKSQATLDNQKIENAFDELTKLYAKYDGNYAKAFDALSETNKDLLNSLDIEADKLSELCSQVEANTIALEKQNNLMIGKSIAEQSVDNYADLDTYTKASLNMTTGNIYDQYKDKYYTRAQHDNSLSNDTNLLTWTRDDDGVEGGSDYWFTKKEKTKPGSNLSGEDRNLNEIVQAYVEANYDTGGKDVSIDKYEAIGTVAGKSGNSVTVSFGDTKDEKITQEDIEKWYAIEQATKQASNAASELGLKLGALGTQENTAGSGAVKLLGDQGSHLSEAEVKKIVGEDYKKDGVNQVTKEEVAKALGDAAPKTEEGWTEWAKQYGASSAEELVKSWNEQLATWDPETAFANRMQTIYDETRGILEQGAQETGMTVEGLNSYAGNYVDTLVETSSSLKGLKKDSKEYKEEMANLTKTAAKMAVQEVKTAKAFDKTREIFEEQRDILKKAPKDSLEYHEALGQLAESLTEVFGTNIDANFVVDNLKDIEAALDGDAEAFKRLQVAAGDQFLSNLELGVSLNGSERTLDDIENVKTKYADLMANMPDIKPGVELDDTEFINGLKDVVTNAKMTTEEANAFFSAMGLQPEFESVTVPMERTATTTVTHSQVVGWEEAATEYESSGSGVLDFLTSKVRLPQIKTWTSQGETTPITDQVSVPAFTVNGGKGAKGADTSLKVRGTNTAKAATSFSKSNGGSTGKSGKSSKKKTQDKKQSKDEVERYHVIGKQLDSMGKKLDDIAKKKDRAFGPSRLKYMDQEIAAMKEQIKLQEQYKKEVEANLVKDKAAIEKYGAVFDADGNITNYEQIVENQLKEYNKAVDTFNKSKQEEADDEALEKAEKKYDKFKEILEQYEETNELNVDVQADLTEFYNQVEDLELEKFTYEVEIKLEVDEDKLKYLDFLLDRVNDDAFAAAESMALLGKQTDLTFNSLNTYLESLDKLMHENGVSEADYSLFMQGDNSALDKYSEVITADELAAMKEYRDGMLNLNNRLFDIQETVQGKVLETFQAWTDEIETQTALFDKYTSTLEHYRNVIDIVGKDTLGISSKTLNELRDAQRDVLHDRMRATKAELEAVTASRERVEQAIASARARGDETSAKSFENDLKEIQAKENELLLDLQAQLEESLQLSKDKFIAATDEMIQDFKNSIAELFGEFEFMKTQYGHFTEKRENYLADYKKMYELNKLNNDLQKSIDETDNIKAKQMLSELQDEINGKMADGSKMTQYELDYLTKKLEIKKAEIALEEAQDAKSQVRLVRQSTGEYGYMYTADQAKIDEAKQDLETKIFELTELTQNYIKEQENQAIALVENMVSEFETIKQMRADNLIDDQQFEQMMEQTRNHYMDQLKLTQVNMEQALTHAKDFYDGDAQAYEELIGYKFINDESYIDHFTETFLSQLGDGYDSWDEMYRDLADSSQDVTDDMVEAAHEMQENFEEDCQEAGYSMDELANEIENGMNTIRNEADQTANEVESMSSEMQSSFSEVVGAVEDWQRAYSAAINTVIEDIRSLVQAQNELNNIKPPKKEEKKEEKPKDTTTTTTDKGGSGSDKKTITDDQIKGIAAAIWYDGHASGWGNWPIRKETLESKFGKGSYEKLQDYINSCIAKDGGQTMYNYGVKLGKSGRKKYYYSSFDTGGYTGSWGNEGRLAMLHQKELVLNPADTENMLTAVSIVRDLLKEIDLRAVSAIVGATSLTPGITPAMTQTLEQDVTIHAEFPNVQDRNEIEEAFKTLVNEASQYANRKR